LVRHPSSKITAPLSFEEESGTVRTPLECIMINPSERDAATFLELCLVAVLRALKKLGAAAWELGDHEPNSLAHDVFLKLWNRPEIRTPSHCVWNTARNTVLDVVTKTRRLARFNLDELPETRLAAPDQGNETAELSTDQVNALLDDVVKMLPPRDRKVVEYCRKTGVELSDNVSVGKALGISANAASAAGSRIRRRAEPLKPRFEELEDRG
jgi:DNA-directed RNA polymerase specialized sigma24 family protein